MFAIKPKDKPNILVIYYPGDAVQTYIASQTFDALRKEPFLDLCNARLVHLNELSDKEIDIVANLECFKSAQYIIAPGGFIPKSLKRIYRIRGPIPTFLIGISKWLAKKFEFIFSGKVPGGYFTGVGAKPLQAKDLAQGLFEFLDGDKPKIAIMQHVTSVSGAVEKTAIDLQQILTQAGLSTNICKYPKEAGDPLKWTEEIVKESDVVVAMEGSGLLIPQAALGQLSQKHGKIVIGYGGKVDIYSGYLGTFCTNFDAMIEYLLQMIMEQLTTRKPIGSQEMIEILDKRILMINEILLRQWPNGDAVVQRLKKSKRTKLVRHWPEHFGTLTSWE